ncbi:MAG: preprotein translocase subunit SecE [Candidatus Levybacteria bacterium]|nr:preprotein translocase subunit SecE [Candidatus Levybacteria bacterium]
MATTPVSFFKEARDELKKVVWPTRQEVIRLTLVVIAVSFIVGVFLGGLDFVFVKIIETIVK